MWSQRSRESQRVILRAGGFTLAGAAILFGGFAAQTPAPPSRFDVVSIKPVSAALAGGAVALPGIQVDPTRLRAGSAALRYLIMQAWDLKNYELANGPGWTNDIRYSVEATTAAPASHDQMMLMLRQALTDAFHLDLEPQEKSGDVYALTEPAGKLVFKPAEGIPDFGNSIHPPAGTSIVNVKMQRRTYDANGDSGSAVSNVLLARQASMADLADALSRALAAPVSDATHDGGRFDFTLAFSSDEASADSAVPWVFQALKEQTGLALTHRHGSYTFYTIAHAEPPPAQP